MRLTNKDIKATLTSFAGLMGLTEELAIRGTDATEDEFGEVVRSYFRDDPTRTDALWQLRCNSLLRMLEDVVNELAKAAVEQAQEQYTIPIKSLDIHVKFQPYHPTAVATVTIRDARKLRQCAGGLFIDAFINEGRVGTNMVDFQLPPNTGCDKVEPSSLSSPVLTSLRHLRRAEVTARNEAEAVRLLRMQELAEAKRAEKRLTAAKARLRTAFGMPFMDEDVPTDSAAAALRRISVSYMAKSVLRCSAQRLPKWDEIRLAIEGALLGNGDIGQDELRGAAHTDGGHAEDSEDIFGLNKGSFSVRKGALDLFLANEIKSDSATTTISCSFDLSKAEEKIELPLGVKRAERNATSRQQLPDFPPAAADSGIMATFICDSASKESLFLQGQHIISSPATVAGGAANPTSTKEQPAEAMLANSSSTHKVVHFMVTDDGTNRVDFINAML